MGQYMVHKMCSCDNKALNDYFKGVLFSTIIIIIIINYYNLDITNHKESS